MGTMNHRPWLPAVLALGLAAASAPAAGENRVERWKCGDLFLCDTAEDRDCNISLTADMDNDRGTVQFDDLPVRNVMFKVGGFERIWAWLSDDETKYAFVIDHDHDGLYFRDVGSDQISDGRFSCHRLD